MLNRRDTIKTFALSGVGLLKFRHAEASLLAESQIVDEVAIRSMGSELNVRWESPQGSAVSKALVRESISRVLDKWTLALSDYDDESETVQLTVAQNVGRWQTVSEELAKAIASSQKWYQISDGAFDVTCGAVTSLRRKRRVVTQDEWQAAIRTIGWDGLEWDPTNRRVKVKREGIRLDFGGIGKGLAVDDASKTMRGLGVERHVLNFAGNLRAAEPPGDRRGWPVEIESIKKLDREPTHLYRFRIANASMATSGDQFQSFPDWKSQTRDERSSHILDPKDGGGLRGKQLVSIMAMEASDADAAATAACVQLRRGNKKWLEELSEREDGLCGVAQEMIGEESVVLEFGGFSKKWQFE